MRIGMSLRNMGKESQPALIAERARHAEAAGVDEIWVTDHVAIPPDDAEGSDGRYVDPLATLAFLAGITSRISLGVGVLVLPYRPALPTAKWIASVQELSGGRMLLGVGSGWMKPEFRALGVPFEERGKRTDRTLDLLHRAFAGDVVEENGQPFLFRPRPARPPIFVGGSPEIAIPRALRFGDGWLPMGKPEELAPHVKRYRDEAAAKGKSAEVVVIASLPAEPEAAIEKARAYVALGATRLLHSERYPDQDAFKRRADAIAGKIAPALRS